MTAPLQPFYLTAEAPGSGDLFCVYHPPENKGCLGAVLYVHPFAEEMNKSRRMAALQCRMLAKAGFAVIQVDLSGCGDSAGDFADATWSGWIRDIVRAAEWLHARHADVPFWLWGNRAGCLLTTAAASMLAPRFAINFLFWQPFQSGKVQLQQFLRLKVAGEMLKGSASGALAELRQRLKSGAPVDVAGYLLASDIATGLEAATLNPTPSGRRLVWLEVTASDEPSLLPASAAALASWEQAGYQVRSQAVRGPAFWQSTEIEVAPALLELTVNALADATECQANA